MEQLLTTDQLATVYNVATGTIRRWASEDRIERIERGRRKLYSLGAVQRAYDRRHPEQP